MPVSFAARLRIESALQSACPRRTIDEYPTRSERDPPWLPYWQAIPGESIPLAVDPRRRPSSPQTPLQSWLTSPMYHLVIRLALTQQPLGPATSAAAMSTTVHCAMRHTPLAPIAPPLRSAAPTHIRTKSRSGTPPQRLRRQARTLTRCALFLPPQRFTRSRAGTRHGRER